jgi:hypothetical protein
MSSAAYKAANYDTNITVDQSQIDALKSRGTPESNFDYYKKNGANATEFEALNRFYGKDKVAAAGISASGSISTNPDTVNREREGSISTNPDTRNREGASPAPTPGFRGGQTWPTAPAPIAPVDRAQDPARVPTPGFRSQSPFTPKAPTTQPVRDSAEGRYRNSLVTTPRASTTPALSDSAKSRSTKTIKP